MTTQNDPSPESSERLTGSAPQAGSAGDRGTTVEQTESGEHLMPQDAVMDYKARWEAIQQGFVDNPRSAVSDADSLVGDVLQRLRTTFENQHHQLESQWSDGEPDTEDLRAALQRYRAFFNRLLSI